MDYRQMNPRQILSALVVGLAVSVPTLVMAQDEFHPPSGKGCLVVVLSGHTGPNLYRRACAQLAELGYNVVLFDSNKIVASAPNRDYDAALRAAIAQVGHAA